MCHLDSYSKNSICLSTVQHSTDSCSAALMAPLLYISSDHWVVCYPSIFLHSQWWCCAFGNFKMLQKVSCMFLYILVLESRERSFWDFQVLCCEQSYWQADFNKVTEKSQGQVKEFQPFEGNCHPSRVWRLVPSPTIKCMLRMED